MRGFMRKVRALSAISSCATSISSVILERALSVAEGISDPYNKLAGLAAVAEHLSSERDHALFERIFSDIKRIDTKEHKVEPLASGITSFYVIPKAPAKVVFWRRSSAYRSMRGRRRASGMLGMRARSRQPCRT